MICSASSRRSALTLGSLCSPKASYSSRGWDPSPAPKIARPPDRTSSEASSRATFHGRRRGSRDHQHAEANVLRACRKRGYGHLRVGDRPTRLTVGDMVPDEDAVPARPLGHAAELDQQPGVAVRADVRQSDGKPHRCHPITAWRSAAPTWKLSHPARRACRTPAAHVTRGLSTGGSPNHRVSRLLLCSSTSISSPPAPQRRTTRRSRAGVRPPSAAWLASPRRSHVAVRGPVRAGCRRP